MSTARVHGPCPRPVSTGVYNDVVYTAHELVVCTEVNSAFHIMTLIEERNSLWQLVLAINLTTDVIFNCFIFIVTIIFSSCGFFFFFFSSPNLTHRRWDVCHTSTHGVALVHI